MSSFPTQLSTNTTPNDSLNRLSGASDKLKKLQLTKKEATSLTFMQKETSTSKLINISNADLNQSTTDPEYEEITVTIRKSERGFGFELKNGILVVKVFPNTPAFYSGIQVGDIILKVNGTCVKSKDQSEITSMIHESNSFVSLTLQRKLPFMNPSKLENDELNNTIITTPNTTAKTDDLNNKQTLKNVTNQISISKDFNTSNSRIDISDDNNNEYDLEYDDNETNNENNLTTSNNNNNNNNNTNNMNIAGTIASSADSSTSKLKEFMDSINDSTLNNEQNNNNEFVKTHRKQHSMSDESFNNLNLSNRNTATNSSVNRRDIKKTRSSTNSKTFQQTQSLSNIAITTLNHSASDNDLDQTNKKILNQQKSNDLNDDNELIDYKDDLSYTSEDNLHESHNDKFTIIRLLTNLWTNTQLSINLKNQDIEMSILDNTTNINNNNNNNVNTLNENSLYDMSGYNDYNQLITKPINLSILLKYLLATENESPKYLYFSMFVDDLINTNDKKETVRWAYELYSTFLQQNAPLKLKINETSSKKIEDLFERNPADNLNQLKKFFEEVKQDAVDVVNIQLSRFRDVKQMGLASLFHGDANKLNQIPKHDVDHMKSSIVESFNLYLNDLSKDILKLNHEWNGSPDTAHISALISSFATFVKKLGLPVKQIGKIDLDKIPMFVNKKIKGKKNSSNSIKGHTFSDVSILSPKTICYKCSQTFWGIGYQGLMCQKTKCEIKIHRHCLATGVTECQKIKIDYKDRLDSFQKMIFGSSKRKEEEQPVPMDLGSLTNSKNGLIDGQLGNLDISGPISNLNDYDQKGNLPVDVAIKKFESLYAKKTSPSIQTSPTSSSNASLNQKIANHTSESSSSSPTGSVTVHRNNSLNNGQNDNLISFKKDNYQQILPNKPNHNYNNNNNNNNSKEQACKRVGSLKVDVKKTKTNVTRSKSDPEPEEIKNAISSTTSNYRFNNDKICVESSTTLVDQNESINNNSFYSTNTPVTQQYSTNSYRPNASPGTLPHQTSSSLFGFTTSNTNVSSSAYPRQSWMNESDMEVDEELPSLSVNIERQNLEQLTQKGIKTQEVINELIHTEQKHVRNLKIMKNHFYIPIKVNMYLTKEERDILFPNLEEVLEIHSNFNNKLKKLRKENPIVPIKQLIDIILEQFEGEQGEKFQIACARFCENQGQAMKLLQLKLKNSDKFNQFITNSENHPICRKLQLKDFIPFEVQRLVKYRLLFNELTKSATDKEDEVRLLECVEASSKISSYVNKAVTECENRKRTEEVQGRMDTREFDQYCTKSPLLVQYRNLDLVTRKLVYEGELEWKLNSLSKHLTALLFEDILVLLERSTDEKRRYVLKPLIFYINKSKQQFTPVIPLSCIDSFKPMNEKRQFHLIAIIRDNNNKENNNNNRESMPSLLSKPQIQNQILFFFVAKSGDDRNKWCTYLQELTGKMSQADKNSLDLTLNRQQSSASSLSHSSSSSTLSQAALSSQVSSNGLNSSVSSSSINSTLQINPINFNDSSTLNSNQINEVVQRKNFDQNKLEEQLYNNSKNISKLLKERQSILCTLNGTNRSIDYDEEDYEEYSILSNANSIERSQYLLNNSAMVLNTIINTFITDDLNKLSSVNRPKSEAFKDSFNNESKFIKNLIKLDNYLNQLRSNINNQQIKLLNESKKESDTINLPNLKLPNILIEKPTTKITNRPIRNVCQLVQNNDPSSDLVSRSIISSSSNNNDLSEDEAINYFDDETNEPILLSVDTQNMRSLSTSSDQTLVSMPNSLVVNETKMLSNSPNRNLDADDEEDIREGYEGKFKKVTYERNYCHNGLDDNYDDDDDDDEIHTNSVLINEDEQQEDEFKTPENEKEDKSSSERSIDKRDLLSIELRDLETDHIDDDYRVPTPPKSEPPSLPLNSYSTDSTNLNDLSDDEVKDYYEDNLEQSNA